VIEVVG